MKKHLIGLVALLIILAACTKTPEVQTSEALSRQSAKKLPTVTTTTTAVTRSAHIFIVWFENKGYPQIIGSSNAPFINSLIKKGTLFTNFYALYHPSQPNYVAAFFGSNEGKTTDDCYTPKSDSHTNLFTALHSVSVTGAWYSEFMPSNGYTGCTYGTDKYARKHNPTVLSTVTYSSTYNKVFDSTVFKDSTKFSALPTVVEIDPGIMDDMHGNSSTSATWEIQHGDAWLKAKLGTLADWCTRHNSILVVYFDEDNKSYGNRIPVVMVGQPVKANYQVSTTYNHYDFLKTVLNTYGANSTFTSNLKSAKIMTGYLK